MLCQSFLGADNRSTLLEDSDYLENYVVIPHLSPLHTSSTTASEHWLSMAKIMSLFKPCLPSLFTNKIQFLCPIFKHLEWEKSYNRRSCSFITECGFIPINLCFFDNHFLPHSCLKILKTRVSTAWFYAFWLWEAWSEEGAEVYCHMHFNGLWMTEELSSHGTNIRDWLLQFSRFGTAEFMV